jgi:hypothetical protein
VSSKGGKLANENGECYLLLYDCERVLSSLHVQITICKWGPLRVCRDRFVVGTGGMVPCYVAAPQLTMVACFSRIVVGIALLVTHYCDIYGVPIDDEGTIAEPNPVQGMQDKLVAAWDCLQVYAALYLLFAG